MTRFDLLQLGISEGKYAVLQAKFKELVRLGRELVYVKSELMDQLSPLSRSGWDIVARGLVDSAMSLDDGIDDTEYYIDRMIQQLAQ